MTEQQREQEYKEWLKTKVDTPAPLSSYPIAIKDLILQKLKELGESIYDNLFTCTDINYLENLK